MKDHPKKAEIEVPDFVSDVSDFAVGDSELVIEYVHVPRRLLATDLFYSLIQFRFFVLLFVILAILTLFLLLCAGIYFLVSPQCGLSVEASLNDAWLFAVLIHFKTCLSPHGSGLFWNGCTEGIFALFTQLFVGNVLMSILLSSLVFNYQSISRRTRARFSAITLSRAACISVHASEKVFLSLEVTEIAATTAHVSRAVANVFVLDPTTVGPSEGAPGSMYLGKEKISSKITTAGSLTCLAHNLPLLITVPATLSVELPSWLFSSDRRMDFCPVCGRAAEGEAALVAHSRQFVDLEHIRLREKLSKPKQELSASTIVRRVRKRELEFIVIVEGSDPLTTDRIQVQKIYRGFLLTETPLPESTREGPEVEIDYTNFL